MPKIVKTGQKKGENWPFGGVIFFLVQPIPSWAGQNTLNYSELLIFLTTLTIELTKNRLSYTRIVFTFIQQFF